MVEFFAEILRHVAACLKLIQANETHTEIHLWDLVEDGDFLQLLKLLEAHPTESISLAATLAWVDPLTSKPLPYNVLREKMCDEHFGTQFWNDTKKIHFLKTICSFDPAQLLKSATSKEFYVRIHLCHQLI